MPQCTAQIVTDSNSLSENKFDFVSYKLTSSLNILVISLLAMIALSAPQSSALTFFHNAMLFIDIFNNA